MSHPVEAYPSISNAFQAHQNGLCNMNATWFGMRRRLLTWLANNVMACTAQVGLTAPRRWTNRLCAPLGLSSVKC
jgi:hypothetical protein